jgi:hypothetical protein
MRKRDSAPSACLAAGATRRSFPVSRRPLKVPVKTENARPDRQIGLDLPLVFERVTRAGTTGKGNYPRQKGWQRTVAELPVCGVWFVKSGT